MLVQGSHYTGNCDRIFIQCVTNEDATTGANIAIGDIVVWDDTTTNATNTKGVYILQLPGSESLSRRVAGVACSAFSKGDKAFVGLVQVYGYCATINFKSGTAAAKKRLVASDTAAKATLETGGGMTAPEAGTAFGTCWTPSGTVTVVEGFISAMG